MKFFSKVLTLNKIHIIDNIIGNSNNGSLKADYFNAGFPVGNPPLLRGSIVIELNESFLTDNADFLIWAAQLTPGVLSVGFSDQIMITIFSLRWSPAITRDFIF